MKVKIFIQVCFLLSLVLLIFFWGCTKKHEAMPNKFAELDDSGCLSCHLNADLLKEVATPIPPDPGEGSGEG